MKRLLLVVTFLLSTPVTHAQDFLSGLSNSSIGTVSSYCYFRTYSECVAWVDSTYNPKYTANVEDGDSDDNYDVTVYNNLIASVLSDDNQGDSSNNYQYNDNGWLLCPLGTGDADGDGWGWHSTALAGCYLQDAGSNTTTSNDYQYNDNGWLLCPLGTGDADGDGWGWHPDALEGCYLQDAGSNTTTSTSSDCPPESDTDGDGWGWNGTEGCLVDSNETTANNNTDSSFSYDAAGNLICPAGANDDNGNGWGWHPEAGAGCIFP